MFNLTTGVRWELLTPTPEEGFEFFYVEYRVGGTSAPRGELIRHMGREYGFILSGELQVQVGLDHYTVRKYESITYDSTRPHYLWNAGSEPVTALWAVWQRTNPTGAGDSADSPKGALP
jgi:mannose-6-phosphate isomerase-like protein (cupin superfamily)